MNWQTNFTERELALIENCRLAVSVRLTTEKGLKYDWNVSLMRFISIMVRFIEREEVFYAYGVEEKIITFAGQYAQNNPAGLPGHSLLIIIAKLNKVLAAAGEHDET